MSGPRQITGRGLCSLPDFFFKNPLIILSRGGPFEIKGEPREYENCRQPVFHLYGDTVAAGLSYFLAAAILSSQLFRILPRSSASIIVTKSQ